MRTGSAVATQNGCRAQGERSLQLQLHPCPAPRYHARSCICIHNFQARKLHVMKLFMENLSTDQNAKSVQGHTAVFDGQQGKGRGGAM